MIRKAYKTDITEAQWQILQPLIPPAKPGGQPRSVNMPEVATASSMFCEQAVGGVHPNACKNTRMRSLIQ